jgi:kumamolisin
MSTSSFISHPISGSSHIFREGCKCIGLTPSAQILWISLPFKTGITEYEKGILHSHLTACGFGQSAQNKDQSSIIVHDTHFSFAGTVEALSKLFNVEIYDYIDATTGCRYHAHAGEIMSVLGLTEHAFGLDTATVAGTYLRRSAAARDTLASSPAASASVTPPTGGYTPLQLAQAYAFPPADGTGQRVGIIELGGGYVQADLNHYFTMLGISGTPQVTAVSVNGAKNFPTDPSGASDEVVLDIEIIAALVPKADIRVYFAPNTDAGFYNAIARAMAEKCSVISISWGGPESSWSRSSLSSFNNLFATASTQGITICVASGDNGASDGSSGLNCDFPASSPYALACGGTRLLASGAIISSETVWNDSEGATGGGVSKVFAKPSYQSQIASISHRGSPDVCGVADPETGYMIYMQGSASEVGGTSCVAPLWAALLTRINQKLKTDHKSPVGFINPVLYKSQSAFRDVTQGNNSGYSAARGWDPCTGLGSPNGGLVWSAIVANR